MSARFHADEADENYTAVDDDDMAGDVDSGDDRDNGDQEGGCRGVFR